MANLTPNTPTVSLAREHLARWAAGVEKQARRPSNATRTTTPNKGNKCTGGKVELVLELRLRQAISKKRAPTKQNQQKQTSAAASSCLGVEPRRCSTQETHWRDLALSDQTLDGLGQMLDGKIPCRARRTRCEILRTCARCPRASSAQQLLLLRNAACRITSLGLRRGAPHRPQLPTLSAAFPQPVFQAWRQPAAELPICFGLQESSEQLSKPHSQQVEPPSRKMLNSSSRSLNFCRNCRLAAAKSAFTQLRKAVLLRSAAISVDRGGSAR